LRENTIVKVTKDSKVLDVLRFCPTTVKVFYTFQIYPFRDLSSDLETVALKDDADLESLLKELNGLLASPAVAGEAVVAWPSGVAHPVRAERLPDGDERDAVILATAHQQPFPGNLLYRAARPHILAVGAYFRLEPTEQGWADAPRPR